MSWLYPKLIRPLLFELDSEQIHDATITALQKTCRHPPLLELLSALFPVPPLPIHLAGLDFPNPIGLAAGMDKAAAALPAWASLGFGFTELGGVTRFSQPGNPKPRMFRLIEEEALINRMGFNNPGADALAARLEQWRSENRYPAHPVGLNLGKSKVTPNEAAAEDYLYSLNALLPYADFFVINVSSPNTPNLRELQNRDLLKEILQQLQAAQPQPRPKPLFVKIAPDLTDAAIDDLVDLSLELNLTGVVATNTTVARPPARKELAAAYGEGGGLSGRPLGPRSTQCIRRIYQRSRGRLTIIGVGGISTAEDAWEKITAGASLLQIYSGLVFHGPGLVRDLVAGLVERMQMSGLQSLHEAVGIEQKPAPTQAQPREFA